MKGLHKPPLAIAGVARPLRRVLYHNCMWQACTTVWQNLLYSTAISSWDASFWCQIKRFVTLASVYQTYSRPLLLQAATNLERRFSPADFRQEQINLVKVAFFIYNHVPLIQNLLWYCRCGWDKCVFRNKSNRSPRSFLLPFLSLDHATPWYQMEIQGIFYYFCPLHSDLSE